MSATELIQQVTALPPQERTRFEQLFILMAMSKGPAGPDRRADWPDFRERLARIYGEKLAPDSHGIIDDGRGDR